MNIYLDKNYRAEAELGGFLGVDGEMNARTLVFRGLTVDGATSYGIEMQLPSGDIISGVIVGGEYTVDSSALTEVGQVRCQVTASAANSIIKKSDIFTLAVLPNLNSAEPIIIQGLMGKVLSQSEYDALSPAQRTAKYLYIIVG